jgi:cell division protein FtsB
MKEKLIGEKGKSKRKRIIFKSLTLIGIILLVVVSIALGKEIYGRHQINQEIEKAKHEIEDLERKNYELQALIDYLNTDSFKEIQARQNLGLQKEGETAVSIEPGISLPSQNQEITFESGEVKESSNPRRWWDYFFAPK